MIPFERTCSYCGWRNESDARMCGGCGQSLGTPSAVQRNAPSAPQHTGGSPTSTIGFGSDAPTAYTPGGVYGQYNPKSSGAYGPNDPTRALDYRTIEGPPPPNAAPARWPAPAPQQTQRVYSPSMQPAKQRGGSCLQRTLLALLALVVVTSCCGVGLWSMVIRPALHTATDSQIRSGLDTLFDEASSSLDQALPLLPKGSYRNILPIKAADLNARIQEAAAKKGMPTGSEVHFIAPDSVQVTYLLSGKPHIATTHLYVVDGRMRARDTADDFPLNTVESNSELEATINEALTHLTPDLHMTDLHMTDDTFYFSFTK